MKTLTSCAVGLALLFQVGVHAQGTTSFTAHLTNSTLFDGHGTFTLTANTFNYDVRTYVWWFSTNLQVRAWPETDTVPLFHLQWTSLSPGIGEVPWYGVFQGTLLLSDDQVSDVANGRWSVVAPAPFGQPFFQGQIVPVPEPKAGILLGLATVSFLLARWRKARSRGSSP